MNTDQPNIFIVEDDKIFQELLKQKLNSLNAGPIEVFQSGEECLNSIYKNPKIVLLDYNLGNMDGLEVLKRIKSYNPDIHVILLSGQEKLEVAINTLKYGAYDYVIKNEVTFKRIEQLIGRITKLEKLIKENEQYKKTRNLVLAGFACVFVGLITVKSFFPNLF